jgi:hypothetical protein
MRIALFYLALVGLVAAFWAAFWPLDRPAPAAVPLAALYAVETELSEQAGAGDADRKLLDAMLAAAKSPADRAETLRRSCGLQRCWRPWPCSGGTYVGLLCSDLSDIEPRPASGFRTFF